MHIQFATSADHPDLTADDRMAADALAARGIRVEPVVWTGPAPAQSADAVVIRSCWDYHTRMDEFIAWIRRLGDGGTAVINPPALVSWNLHKSYLVALARSGIPVVPTLLTQMGDDRTLREMIDAAEWEQAVVKPAVSLNAYETWRVDARETDLHDDRFARLRSRGDVLVQQFLPHVMTEGEWSLIFFGAHFSHAVRKRPQSGDFRVQVAHGGSAVAEDVSPELIAAAARVLRALPVMPVYCRVDGVIVDGVFTVMEVECIDPVLFLAERAGAAEVFADEVVGYLAG